MKHAYSSACTCERCLREKERRARQRLSTPVSPPMTKPRRGRRTPLYASRAEQHARYIDCGPGAWDDRD